MEGKFSKIEVDYGGLFSDESKIQFKLLDELVRQGQMTFYQAIVLIIRERATLIQKQLGKKGKRALD